MFLNVTAILHINILSHPFMSVLRASIHVQRCLQNGSTHLCVSFVCYYIFFFCSELRKPNGPEPKAISEKKEKKREKERSKLLVYRFLPSLGSCYKNGKMEMKVLWCKTVTYRSSLWPQKVRVTVLTQYLEGSETTLCAKWIFIIVLYVRHSKHQCGAISSR